MRLLYENKDTGTMDNENNRLKGNPRTRMDELLCTASGELIHLIGTRRTRVNVKRCFPWSQPDHFFSLRDDDGKEVMLVEKLDDLSHSSRRALLSVLRESGFVFTIEKVLVVEQEFDLRYWKVETSQGRRKFQTEVDDWPRSLSEQSFLIQDLAGDLYFIENEKELDEKSRALIEPYIR